MNCQDVQKFAYTYLDAEFDGRERGEFETHLRLCQPCRATVERDAVFRDLVRDKLCTGVSPCGDLRQKLQARLVCEERRRQRTAMVIPLAMVAGLGCVVVAWQWQRQSSVLSASAHQDTLAAAPVALPNLAPASAGRVQIPAGRTPSPVLALQASAPGVGIAAAVPSTPARLDARAEPSPGLHLVSASGDDQRGEVLGGAMAPGSLVSRSPFGAVRSEPSLRAMARVHAANMPPEVTGPATRVQRYLAQKIPGIGPLPLSEGAGVELVGARLALMGPQLMVVYSYRAYGTPLTIFSRAKATDTDDPEVEVAAPDSHDSGVLLDQRAGLHLLHVVSHDRMLTLVSELSAAALLPLVPKATWL